MQRSISLSVSARCPAFGHMPCEAPASYPRQRSPPVAILGVDSATFDVKRSNSLILRCSASEGGKTSEFASQLIGQRAIPRETVSVLRSSGEFMQGGQRSVSCGTAHRVEQAVLPSEIEALPDPHGFLEGASSEVWVRVAF